MSIRGGRGRRGQLGCERSGWVYSCDGHSFDRPCCRAVVRARIWIRQVGSEEEDAARRLRFLFRFRDASLLAGAIVVEVEVKPPIIEVFFILSFHHSLLALPQAVASSVTCSTTRPRCSTSRSSSSTPARTRPSSSSSRR